MTVDLNAIIREYALELVDDIKETNKAIEKTGDHQFEIGRSFAYGMSLYMLLNRLERSGANLCEMGLCRIDPLALVKQPPEQPAAPSLQKKRPYGKRSRY